MIKVGIIGATGYAGIAQRAGLHDTDGVAFLAGLVE